MEDEQVSAWQNNWLGQLLDIGKTAVANLTAPEEEPETPATTESWWSKVNWQSVGLFIVAALVGLLLLRRLLK